MSAALNFENFSHRGTRASRDDALERVRVWCSVLQCGVSQRVSDVICGAVCDKVWICYAPDVSHTYCSVSVCCSVLRCVTRWDKICCSVSVCCSV